MENTNNISPHILGVSFKNQRKDKISSRKSSRNYDPQKHSLTLLNSLNSTIEISSLIQHNKIRKRYQWINSYINKLDSQKQSSTRYEYKSIKNNRGNSNLSKHKNIQAKMPYKIVKRQTSFNNFIQNSININLGNSIPSQIQFRPRSSQIRSHRSIIQEQNVGKKSRLLIQNEHMLVSQEDYQKYINQQKSEAFNHQNNSLAAPKYSHQRQQSLAKRKITETQFIHMKKQKNNDTIKDKKVNKKQVASQKLQKAVEQINFHTLIQILDIKYFKYSTSIKNTQKPQAFYSVDQVQPLDSLTSIYQRLQKSTTVGLSHRKYKNSIITKKNQLKKQFTSINDLQKYIRDVLTKLIEIEMQKCNQQTITIKECKINIAKKVLEIHIDIMKFLLQKKYTPETIVNVLKQIIQLITKLLIYLKIIYPKVQPLFAANFAKKFQEIDHTEHLQNDILKNSRTYFCQEHQFQIAKTIKLFFNKIIEESNEQFKTFQQILQQIESQSYDQKIEFHKNRKLPQNTQEYSYKDLNSGFIEIKCSEILRLMIKWNQDLEQYFEPKNKKYYTKITDEKNQFKFYTENQEQGDHEFKFQSCNFYEVKNLEKKGLIQQIQKYLGGSQKQPQEIKHHTGRFLNIENINQKSMNFIEKKGSTKSFLNNIPSNNEKPIKQRVRSAIPQSRIQTKVQKISPQRFHQNIESAKSTQIKMQQSGNNQFYTFNMLVCNIIKNVQYTQNHIRSEQLEIMKLSSWNSQFLFQKVSEKLIQNIKNLIKIGKKFKHPQHGILDLVKFKINDILRCRVYCKKKAFQKIYDKFIQIAKSQRITIVKIKNRLKTPMNDIMILFKLKQSFFICECQIILNQQSQGKQSIKKKNIENFNHFLYELTRSSYGFLAEASVFLQNRCAQLAKYYQEKIFISMQKSNQLIKCKGWHKQNNLCYFQQTKAFICSQCLKFYPKRTNSYHTYQCSECLINICNKCEKKKSIITKETIKSAIMYRLKQLYSKQTKIDKSQIQIIQKKKQNFTQFNKRMQHYWQIYSQMVVSNLFTSNEIKFTQFSQIKQLKNGIKIQNLLKYFIKSTQNIEGLQKSFKFGIISLQGSKVIFKFFIYDSKQKYLINLSRSRQYYFWQEYIYPNQHDILIQFPNQQFEELPDQDKQPNGKITKQITSEKNIENYPQEQTYSVQANKNKGHFKKTNATSKSFQNIEKIIEIKIQEKRKQETLNDDQAQSKNERFLKKKTISKLMVQNLPQSSVQSSQPNIHKHALDYETKSILNNSIVLCEQHTISSLQNFIQNISQKQNGKYSLIYATLKNTNIIFGVHKYVRIQKRKGLLKRLFRSIPQEGQLRQTLNVTQMKLQNDQLKIFGNLVWKQSIKHINFSNNLLQNVSALITQCVGLETLNIDNNKVSGLCINSDSLRLTSITATKNGIKLFSPQKFPNLETIDLSYNNLESLVIQQDSMSYLKVLNVSHNQLKSVKNLSHLRKNIQKIFLNNNPSLMQILNENTEVNFPTLKQSMKSFDMLTQLQLSETHLSKISHFSEWRFPKLIRIGLNKNKVQLIPKFQAPNLEFVSALKNPFKSIKKFCSGYYYNNLKNLHLSQMCLQQLMELPQNVQNLTLQNSQLKNDQIRSMFSKKSLPKLKYLSLQDNSLSFIPQILLYLPGLKNLNLKQTKKAFILQTAQTHLNSIKSENISVNIQKIEFILLCPPRIIKGKSDKQIKQIKIKQKFKQKLAFNNKALIINIEFQYKQRVNNEEQLKSMNRIEKY